MPGGMGGGMGLLGQLLGGMGGGPGGGMGGGMGGGGGRGMGGGPGGGMGFNQNQNQNQNKNSSSEETEEVNDEYDVDRWKRADEDEMTNIEQVRADWDEKEEKKKSLFSRFRKKKNKNEEDERYIRRPSQGGGSPRRQGGPGGMPGGEMPGTPVQAEQEAAPDPKIAAASAIPFEDDIVTPYERFFSANPLNSSILAMDELSLGPLTLNQVGLTRDQKAEKARMLAAAKAKEEESFMESRKQALQQRQYEVHVVGEKKPNRML